MKSLVFVFSMSAFSVACANAAPKPAAEKQAVAEVVEQTPPAPLEKGIAPWSPEKPEPAEKQCGADPGRPHLQAAWVPLGSLEDLVRRSELIVKGHVTGATRDVIRSVDNPKEGKPALDASGQPVHADLPMTIVHFAIDEVIVGKSAAAPSTIDTLFTGGLLEDGCLLEPEDNPLPRVGERAVLFLKPVGQSQLVRTPDARGIFTVVGGPQGRIKLDGDTVVPLSPVQGPDGGGLATFRGKPVSALLSRVRAVASTPQPTTEGGVKPPLGEP